MADDKVDHRSIILGMNKMIDLTAKHLEGLRTICVATEEITQKEIKETEVRENNEY